MHRARDNDQGGGLTNYSSGVLIEFIGHQAPRGDGWSWRQGVWADNGDTSGDGDTDICPRGHHHHSPRHHLECITQLIMEDINLVKPLTPGDVSMTYATN